MNRIVPLKVFKYPLEDSSGFHTQISIPEGEYKILSVGLDPTNRLCLWIEVDPTVDITQELLVAVIGTGWNVDGQCRKFLGSVTRGLFVWHIYTA